MQIMDKPTARNLNISFDCRKMNLLTSKWEVSLLNIYVNLLYFLHFKNFLFQEKIFCLTSDKARLIVRLMKKS